MKHISNFIFIAAFITFLNLSLYHGSCTFYSSLFFPAAKSKENETIIILINHTLFKTNVFHYIF